MKIDKKSWHYRLVQYGCNFRNYELNTIYDFCGYLRKLLWGIVNCCFIIFFGSVTFGILFAPWIFYLVAAIDLGFFPEFIDIMIVLPFILLLFGGIFLNDYLKEKLRERKRNTSTVTIDLNEPGFFSLLIAKIKNKVCYKIEFKD